MPDSEETSSDSDVDSVENFNGSPKPLRPAATAVGRVSSSSETDSSAEVERAIAEVPETRILPQNALAAARQAQTREKEASETSSSDSISQVNSRAPPSKASSSARTAHSPSSPQAEEVHHEESGHGTGTQHPANQSRGKSPTPSPEEVPTLGAAEPPGKQPGGSEGQVTEEEASLGREQLSQERLRPPGDEERNVAVNDALRHQRDQRVELRRLESAFWNSLCMEDKEKLQMMFQVLEDFRSQLRRSSAAEMELQSVLDSKGPACHDLRLLVEKADHEARVARERELRNIDQISRWDTKRLHCEEASEGVELLRLSLQNVQAELKRLEDEAQPGRSELSSLRERLTASQENSRQSAARLTALKAQYPQRAAELKASQVKEMTDLRSAQAEELLKLEVDWTTQVSDMRSLHSDDVRCLKQSLEETTRRAQRMVRERDDAREQALARQREGSRLQQQCADARHEVLELSAQVRLAHPANLRAPGLSRSLSASFLDSPILSIKDAQCTDAEMLDLRQRCKDLERQCTRMHSLLERGQEACERWRRQGISANSGGIDSADDAGGRPEPFALGPVESLGGSEPARTDTLAAVVRIPAT